MSKNPTHSDETIKTGPDVKYLVQLSLMIALVVLVSFIPILGYIPLVVIKATTVHIPVIIGAILLGPKAGAVLGFTMGITSMIKATVEPGVTSFLFSPFMPVPGKDSGDLRAILIAIVPRVLIGVIAGWAYRLIAKLDKRGFISCGAAALLGSLANTLLVLGGIWLMFGEEYAAALEVPFAVLGTVLMGIIATNGLAEAAVAVIICVLLVRPLKNVLDRRKGKAEGSVIREAAEARAEAESLKKAEDERQTRLLDEALAESVKPKEKSAVPEDETAE